MVKANVKWGAKQFEVEIDPSSTSDAFKAQLLSLTGVPIARQKLMSAKAWKGILKDGEPMNGVTAAGDGFVVTLMGTAEVLAKDETTKTATFVEDMPASAVAQAGISLPAGLQNYENTCYCNSTLEALRYIPELKESLVEYRKTAGSSALHAQMAAQLASILGPAGAASGGAGGSFAGAGAGGGSPFAAVDTALADLYTRLDSSPSAILPSSFLASLRAVFPQFAERGAGGGFKQHDSEEFTTLLLNALATELKKPTGAVPTLRPRSEGNPHAEPNVVDTLFGIEFEEELRCRECEAEAPVVKRDFQRKLVCNIEGGTGRSVQINNLSEGVLLGLTGEVTKRSEILGRDAVWSKVSRIVSLPKYLCVQFMRFFWKATPDNRDHRGVNCKMLRPVNFPADNFDTAQFCAKGLQDRLRAMRDKLEAADNTNTPGAAGKVATTTNTASPAAAGAGSSSSSSSSLSSSAMEEDDTELAAALKLSMDSSNTGSSNAGSGAGAGSSSSSASSPGAGVVGYLLPETFRGFYDLFAIVTHKGRSSDSGHYIAWVRKDATTAAKAKSPASGSGDRNKWLVFDDETLSEVDTDYVTSHLKGGGDEHMAYLAFYRAKE